MERMQQLQLQLDLSQVETIYLISLETASGFERSACWGDEAEEGEGSRAADHSRGKRLINARQHETSCLDQTDLDQGDLTELPQKPRRHARVNLVNSKAARTSSWHDRLPRVLFHCFSPAGPGHFSEEALEIRRLGLTPWAAKTGNKDHAIPDQVYAQWETQSGGRDEGRDL